MADIQFNHLGQGGEAGTPVLRRTRVQWIQLLLMWLAVIAALARPQWLDEPLARDVPMRDLLVALDLSGSMDTRDFTDAATLLRYFRGDGPFRLLTNNPKKIEDLSTAGLVGITPVKHVFGVTEANRRYLAAKRDWGHKLNPEDFD